MSGTRLLQIKRLPKTLANQQPNAQRKVAKLAKVGAFLYQLFANIKPVILYIKNKLAEKTKEHAPKKKPAPPPPAAPPPDPDEILIHAPDEGMCQIMFNLFF